MDNKSNTSNFKIEVTKIDIFLIIFACLLFFSGITCLFRPWNVETIPVFILDSLISLAFTPFPYMFIQDKFGIINSDSYIAWRVGSILLITSGFTILLAGLPAFDIDVHFSGELRVHERELIRIDNIMNSSDPSDGTYIVEDPTIVSVDEYGYAEGLKPGETTITIKYQLATKKIIVKVYYEKVEKIDIKTEKVKVDIPTELEYEVFPYYSTDLVNSITSSDTNVIAISDDGKLIGITPGETVITITTSDGYSTSKTILVTEE